MQETFLEKNTLNHQCWETSREYNQVNGPTAFSSPGEFSGYLCVYRWVWCWVLVCRAAYTFHGIPDGWCLSVLWSQRGSFLFHLLSSVRAFAVTVIMSYYVNNCSTKCNILGQNLAIGCERVKTEISVHLPGTGHLEEAKIWICPS